MEHNPTPRIPQGFNRGTSRAFTIVEMLVTIAVIAILAAILIPTVNKAFAKSRRLAVQNELINFAQAVDLYFQEYGRLPIPGGTSYSTNDTAQVLQVLQGSNIVSGTVNIPNPRKIIFYEGELISSDIKFEDVWGNPISLQFDTDYDNKIEYDNKVDPKVEYAARVLVISPGPNPNDTSDDVLSVKTEN